jgi:flagellar biosynthesis protein FliR
MAEFTTAQLFSLVSAFFWPLVRVLGLFSSGPFFSHRSIPIRIRVGLGVAITFLIAPTLAPFPITDPISWMGMLVLTQQFLIGVAIGFIMRLIFSGVELSGELIGMTMGFGFASFFNPQSGGQSSAINQLLSLLTMLIFIATDLHLQLLESLVESFNSLPIGMNTLGKNSFQQLAFLGKNIFSISIQLSLPIIAALLMTNMALGVLTKAAPQLNLFGIGFPITMLVGFLMIDLLLPYWSMPLYVNLQQGINMIRTLLQATI